MKRRPVRTGAVLVAAIAVGVVFSAAAQAAPGDLDLIFSGDGKQTTSLGFGSSTAAATVPQPDGKIVVVGTDASGDFVLARYNPNGSLDTTFSGDGKQRTDFSGDSGFDQGMGVALQGNGKIVAVGSGGPNADFALARYNPNGSLDTTFSGDGKQTTDFGGPDFAGGVAIQGDGKVVAVGRGVTTAGNFALARYNPNGSLDTTFSGDGKQTTSFPGGSSEARGVALQGNGKIVAAGSRGGNFALARYDPNGSLDPTFSGDGRLTTDFGGFEFATGVALQGNGKIVAAGVGSSNGPIGFALARYNPNGSLDTTFSGDGKQTTGFGGAGGEVIGGVALQADAKIVVVGRGGTTDDFALARYNPNGTLDTSFSGDGLQTSDFGFGADDQATGVVLQGDGRIVAAGYAGGGATDNDFALARYNPNGSLDLGFSGDGRRRTNFGGADRANGVVLQTNGRIVLAGGGLGPDQTTDFALARYLGD